MPDFVDRWGAALLDASLAATAISGFVVLAIVQCRQPVRRRGWARVGLAAMLTLLPLAALNPFPRIDLQGPLRSILPGDLDGTGSVHPPRSGALPGRGGFVAPLEPDRGSGHPGAGVAPTRCPGPPGWACWLGRGAVVAYLGGFGCGIVFLSLGVWGSSLVIRRASIPSAGSLALYASLADPASLGRPGLRVSTRAGRPVLLGVFRPAILIPPELDRPAAAEQLRLSLLHELAHAESADHLFGLLANLAQATWFFLPPVWWIRDQMRLDQEFLADRRAVDRFGTSGHYASSLVELATSDVGLVDGADQPRVEPARPGVASALFQRVLMLLKCPFALEGRTPVWWRWLAASTLGLATVAGSCLTLRGLADWSEPVPASRAARSFRLPQLVIGQNPKDDQPFDLRFRLPERFDLTFEVLADPDELPALEVLGHRMGPPRSSGPAPLAYRLWHRVRITRSGGVEEVEVDGHAVADPSRMPRISTWLSIRATTGRITRIRDLALTW